MTKSITYKSKSLKPYIGYLAILWAILIAASIHYNANRPDRLSNPTLTYDVAGYYMYLPATFIYDDLRTFSFKDTLHSPEIAVGIHEGKYAEKTGNFVFKYSSGMALQYLPAFSISFKYWRAQGIKPI